MKARNTLPIILIAVASTGAYLSTSTHEPTPERGTAVHHRHHSPAVVAHHGNHDAVAAHDMMLHAVEHLDDATARPESFRIWPRWTPEWELRLLSFEQNGHTAHVYHATHKRHPEIRFTITADANASHDWVRAY